MRRRDFLLAAPAAASAPAALAAESEFSFIHFTDTHIQPELRAAEGTRKAFAAINGIEHDFCIAGGDLVMDVFEQGPQRSKMLFDLYTAQAKDLKRKVYSIAGNHDVYGVSAKAGVASSDPLYGKKMFEDRIGPRYQSFDHKGWHFILLDSVFVDDKQMWWGGFDEPQLDWLKRDLDKVNARTPIVVAMHIPLATAMGAVVFEPNIANFLVVRRPQPVLDLFEGRNVKAVLQGHTHIREVVHYNGCQFITTGAVSGNWWKGLHKGHPEGFGVVHIKGGELRWEYRTYGWQASA